jgi:hypothetical protein
VDMLGDEESDSGELIEEEEEEDEVSLVTLL